MTALGMGLLLLVLAAFVGLDGIGRGSVLRAVTGTAGRPRDDVLAATGPQLLLGHVWLIAAAGLLVGLFPRWESAVVSHAYWWVLAVVAGLVLRVAAIGTGALSTRGAAPGSSAPGTRPIAVTGTAGPGRARRAGGSSRRGAPSGTPRAPGSVLAALAATGALATAAGTGGFLAAAAGVWPVLGAVAVVALDVVLGGWWLGATTPRWASVAVGALLCVSAAVLMAAGAVTGGAAVVVLAMAGALLGVRPAGVPAAVDGRSAYTVPSDESSSRRSGVDERSARAARGDTASVDEGSARTARLDGGSSRAALPAAVLLVAAVVAPLAARWPDLAVPGTGAVPVAELAAGPVSASLVTGVAGPAFLVVLGVQAWFWWDRARAVRG